MKAVTKLGIFAYLLAALVVALDQASKFWILHVFQLPLKVTVPVAGPFHLTMVWNRGVSFGLLRADVDLTRWALVAFSIIVSVFLAVWVRKAGRALTAVALGLVMGGAVGNVVDRIRFGAVADFIDVSRLWFPWIFNVADAAITIGIALLLLDMLMQEKQGQPVAQKDAI
ncbi:MAG TPA: signal peptidase II [Phenylobacterium sp.]|uniref:signal peptidase II n=1 Tax=Phenylobacterium sp. TaxID=1871053 RepID=UPI002B4666F3|nr:signal peptidase II [Phenylobacterium sp.]HKR89866.1 signal peptidase II [Phenylobacterium sp.]